MRVLLLNQFFHPDLSAVAQLATDLAEDLTAAGHQVTALAARGAYLGGQRLPPRETWHGVEIVRVGASRFGKGSITGRLADYATFYASALATALTLPRHDVVLATTAPPLVASIGAVLRAVKGTRFVSWLQDVYPELAVEFGVLGPRSPATWVFERISQATLRRADGVVVLGEAMADRVRVKGVEAERIHVVPNWADGSGIRPVPPHANAFRREHGLDGKRVVLYSGNMGRGHDLTTLLEAARRLRGEQDLVFAFVGDGARKAEVEVAARALPSVRLFPYQPRERLAESLSAGDVHVVTMDPCTLGLLEPSKLYGVLAAGRPALVIGPPTSEVARTVTREGVGEVVANGDVDGTITALGRLLAAAGPLGERSRQAFDRSYDRRHRTTALAAILADVAEA
jgi:glycosyltransferase involved in cell wall biosynthesis